MKTLIVSLLCIILLSSYTLSQDCDSCGCATKPTYTSPDPATFIGGKLKPNRSDLNNTDPNNYFPILVVFVQFKNESGDSTSTDFESWPARRAPNYLNSVIGPDRIALTNWWDSYNGYAISDFWHEFSRGKLHIRGQAVSVILPQDSAWYRQNGGAPKVNKDIYDALIAMQIDWPFYDKWTYISPGTFSYTRDERVDMIYMVYRSQARFIFDNDRFWGYANLGSCENAVNDEYLVYQNSGAEVRIRGNGSVITGNLDTIGSGVILWGGSASPLSRQRVLDVATHEHGHYFFGSDHKLYGKMADGPSSTSEFSLSPWEMVKLGYVQQQFVNYSNPVHNLYDYMSRGGTAGTQGEILQVPVNESGSEFFLMANRSRVSEWDRRLGGDTLSGGRYNFLRNVDPKYGSGLYIYHIYNGYSWQDDEFDYKINDKDLECADGLWKWVTTGITKPLITGGTSPLLIRSYPIYDNDNPYTTGSDPKDEMSKGILFSPGSPDNLSANPNIRGVSSIFVNDQDYYNSFCLYGDRWDAWNTGYNEVFSPYSSPSTKDSLNQNTGIFIWYKALDTSNNKATLEIYRTGYGGKSEAQILELTPPSRPMGLRVLSCDSLPTINGYKRIKLRWFHNMEPDMIQLRQGVNDEIRKYQIYRTTTSGMDFVPGDRMQYPENDYQLYRTVDIDVSAIPEFIDSALVSVCDYPNGVCPPNCCNLFPVRYRVQAVDKYETPSVLSDFAKTEAWNVSSPEGCAIGPDNFVLENNPEEAPKEFSLSNAFPNPFNPATLISYTVPVNSHVRITVYDINGKEIANLANSIHEPGFYEVSFNAASLSSGTYFCIMKAGEFAVTRKLVVVK